MKKVIRIVILEDHQPAVDGYHYRLSQSKEFKIVAVATYGEELIPTLQQHPADVLLLDINVPISEDNRDPFPILSLIVELRDRYPELKIIVISMHGERTLIEAALKAGVNGYLLKDDRTAIQNLGGTIHAVLQGGSYLSQYTLEKLSGDSPAAVSLSPRQLQILSLCAANPNLTKAEIAKSLNIADSTVRNLLASAYQRLEVRNLAAAIAAARALGILTPPPPIYPYQTDEFDLVESLS